MTTEAKNYHEVLSPAAILKFSQLSTPSSYGARDKASYSAVLVFEGDDGLAEMLAVMDEVIAEACPNVKNRERYANPLKAVQGGPGWAENLPGTYYMRVKSNYKPFIVDIDNNPVEANEVADGSKVRCILRPDAFDVEGNKGLCMYLNAVQVLEFADPNNTQTGAEIASRAMSMFGAKKVAGSATRFAPAAPPADAPMPEAFDAGIHDELPFRDAPAPAPEYTGNAVQERLVQARARLTQPKGLGQRIGQ